ncbi:hypothetical protein BOTBODRAFT_182553 [Botryobasidium botryosum FD-172 SS1]|uniref:Uncharacterized protein n=1 Tax=Botryobasidium botryosum (strain FD-172 SS1) TaxID=930990 RepID=A0A067LTB5_BOTB1|nr:hypothetical protein BOTBODRAFT_182553 [Botryobasidium botryosum FD-172 SS1]
MPATTLPRAAKPPVSTTAITPTVLSSNSAPGSHLCYSALFKLSPTRPSISAGPQSASDLRPGVQRRPAFLYVTRFGSGFVAPATRPTQQRFTYERERSPRHSHQ